MAISMQYGTNAQKTGVTMTLLPWDYSLGFRVISDSGTLARMADILGPLDKKTTVKVTLDKIANVYTTLADGSVPVAEQNANVTGSTVFTELKTIATKVVGSQTIQLPMVARIELRLPNDSDITEADVTALVMATFATLCDSNGTSVVMSEKMRGALTPAGI